MCSFNYVAIVFVAAAALHYAA